MSTFAYSVAIKLSVANLASQGIRILAKDLMSAHGNAVALGDKLKALKMVAIGYGMDKAGQGILGFMGKSIDASKEYTRQLSLMNAAGMTHRDIAEATASAWKTSRDVITSSATDNLSAIRDLRSVLGARPGGLSEAFSILPAVQRTKGILEALTGKSQDNIAFDMVKAIDTRTLGLMSASRIQQNADLMSRTLMAFGNTLNVSDFHMALKQSRTAALGFNDDFVYNYLPTMMQEVKTKGGGAQTAGTAIMSAYQQIVGGTIKKSAIPLWESMGLLSPGAVVRNSSGQMQVAPGGFVNSQLFQENPYAYAQFLKPIIAQYANAHNMNTNQVVAGMFGNRLAQWAMTTFIGKTGQFEKDKDTISRGGNSYQTYQKLLQSNPQLAEQAMHAQWSNILSILGYKVLPALIPLMLAFATGLNRIGDFMQKHGTITSVLAFGLLGVGSSLSVIGKALMTAGLIKFLGMGPLFGTMLGGIGTGIRVLAGALFMNPIGLTLTALAAAAFLLYENWSVVGPALKTAWNAIYNGVVSFINGIIALANHLPFVHISPIAQQTGSPYVPSNGSGQPPIHTQVNVDGKKVADAVTYWQHKGLLKPNQGKSSFDGSRSWAPPSVLTR